MLLKRLTLRNIGPHRKLDIAFKPGLIGIFGANGAGKSTITNSMYGCMTNDFSRFPGTREKIINDQAEPGELAEISCDLDIDGIDYALKRDLGRGKCRMEFTRPGQPRERIEKDGEFQQALFKALGFPRDVLDNFVFIDQWETFAFLKSTPAKRMMAFHGLCNTGKAEKIWDAVGHRLAADAGLVAEVQDNLAEFRKQKDDTAAEYVRLHGELTGMTRVGADELAEMEQRVSDLTALANLQQNLTEAEEALASASASSLSAATKLLPLKKERDRLQAAVDAIDTVAAETCIPILQEYISQQKQIESDKQQIDELDALLADLSQDAELELPAGTVYEPMEEINKRLVLNKAELATARAYVKNFTKSSKCPTCGQDATTLLAKYQKTVAELPEQIAHDEETIDIIADFNTEVAGLNRQRSDAEAKLTALRTRLDSATFVVLDDPAMAKQPESSLEEFKLMISKKKLAELALATYVKVTLSPAEAKANVAKGAVAPAEKRVIKLKADLLIYGEASADDLPAAKAELADTVAANNRYTTAHALAKAAKTTAETAAESYKRAKKALEDARERSQTARAWLEHLEKIREVFHRSAAPQMVAQSRLEALEDDINKTLELFGNPFTVRAGEDFNLLAQIPGHEERPAQFLSGGQKVILSIAFLLSQSPGLLILDEPGAGLDASNRAYLKTAFASFQQTAKDRGLQVICITHDESAASSFNQVIQLPSPD